MTRTHQRRWSGRLWRVVGFLAVGVLLVVGGLVGWATLRYARAVQNLTRGVGDTTFLSSDGTEWFRLDEERHDVPLAEISPALQRAVLAVEDRRFFYHPGIDPIGVARAIVADIRAGGRVEGGSTLTQQLARTLFLSNRRSFGRKAREAAIALLLEVQLTKPQILELYLNRVYLSAGVYGVETMSEHLFRKPARDVTLAEAAMIAGLIRAPSALSPWSNYEGALARSRLVLSRMRDQGLISVEQESAALTVRPEVQPYRLAREGASGWAKDYLRQQFRNQFGGDHPPEWRVRTTFDRRVQEAAEQAVASGLKRLNRTGLQAAFVALDPKTGGLLAMVGGADYMRSTFNRAVRSRRQPGSAFKPILYASALSHGYSPVSVLTGLTAVSAPGDPDWAPSNGDHAPSEALTLREALVESNNAAAAVLQKQVGSRVVLGTAGEVGLHDLPDVPSLALGSGEVTPLDLTTAFAVFANGGYLPALRSIASVADAKGTEVYAQPVALKPVISAPVAFQMVSMLRDVVDRGTGSGVRALGVRGPVAGKTGTTNDYHDAWFVGFSSSVVAGVWVGFDDPAPIGRNAYAARIAAPIWADFMKRIAKAYPPAEFPIPPDVESVTLCRVSHQQPVTGCPTYTEYFKAGDEIPSERCSVHQGRFEERAARAVSGFFKSLGSKIKGIFGGK
jgi:penicillin-binding protein 1A